MTVGAQLLILLNAVCFIVATVPSVEHTEAFYVVEFISSVLFLIEYLLRLVVATEDPKYAPLGPCRGRLRYAVTPRALIDAAATFPFFVELAFGVDLANTTYLRVLRVFRILKTDRTARALSSIYRVLCESIDDESCRCCHGFDPSVHVAMALDRVALTRWLPCAQGYNAEILSVGLLLAMLLVFFTAMLLYYLRPPDPADPAFESIPATLYLALLMLCGQGQPEGDLPSAPTTFV